MKSIKLLRKISEWYLSSTYGYNPFHDRFEDMVNFLKNNNPIVLDVGANIGETINIFLKSFSNPNIIAFEPLPECYALLCKKFAAYKNINLNNCAIGYNEGVEKFNVTKNIAASSLLAPSKESIKHHNDELDITNLIDVKINRLSRYIQNYKEIDILKIDTQGYELSVLQSAESLIEKIKIISLEVEFIPLYDNQPLFSDIDVFLREKGFYLYNIYGGYRRKNGQLEFADATYLNRNFFDNII